MKYWNNIDDLPIYYYHKVIEDKSLDHLIYEKSDMVESKKLALLSKAWEEIELQFYAMQMRDPRYIEGLKDEVRHYNRKIKAALSGKALDKLHYQNSARRFEPENGKDFDFWQSIFLIQRHAGIQIDPKTYSTRLYYTALNSLKNESERAQRAIKKKKNGNKKN